MKEKNFIYSYKGILLILLLASLIGVGAGIYGVQNNLFSHKNDFEFYHETYDRVNSSLFKEDNNTYYGSYPYRINFINSYVRSYKISNYKFTEEFKKKSNSIVLDTEKSSNRYREYSSYGEALEAAKNMGIQNPKINTDVTEEPKYEIFHLSNTTSDDFDPQEISMDLSQNKDNIVISGIWDNDKIKFIKDIGDVSDDKQNYAINLKNAIREVYSNIGENGTQKINFTYVIDTQSKDFNNYIQSVNYRCKIFPNSIFGIMLGLILIGILGIVCNFKDERESKFYKGIVRIPVEIVIFMAIPAWIICAAGADSFFLSNLKFTQEILSPFYGLQIVAIMTMGIAILYLIYSLKDLFYNGISAMIIENSIIGRILNYFGKKSKEVSNEYLKDFDPGKRRNLVIAFIGFIILGLLACNLIVRSGFELIVFVIWVGLLLFIFLKFQKYVLELEDIEKTAKIISEGHYDIKISEDNSEFKSLAHNLNLITDNLDNAISKAVKSERMKTDLIANVSHDLKTPLTSIINYSELITEENDPENIKKYSKVINEKSLKLKTLIEDLFEVSKVSSDNVDLNIEELDFKQLIKQIIGEWEDKLSEKNITVIENYFEGSVILNLDGVKTSRVLDNLFSNIYKYALEGTRVYIDLYKEENVKLTIKNMSKYPLNISKDELMERFTRGDKSRNTEGSGLGLSIAQSLVNVQKGTFDIEIDGDLFKSTIIF